MNGWMLHLQDSLESGPTWCVHERRSERGVVRDGDLAEELLFFLCVVRVVSGIGSVVNVQVLG